MYLFIADAAVPVKVTAHLAADIPPAGSYTRCRATESLQRHNAAPVGFSISLIDSGSGCGVTQNITTFALCSVDIKILIFTLLCSFLWLFYGIFECIFSSLLKKKKKNLRHIKNATSSQFK